MRESLRCPHCGMTQWRTEAGTCRRCGKHLDAPAVVMDVPPDQPQTALRRRPFPTRMVVVLSVVVVVAGVAALVVPRLLDGRGTPVGLFTDSPKLIEMELPKGWYHLRIDRRDLPIPHPDNEVFWRSIRGSFYLGKRSNPYAILYLRVDVLGLSAGPVQRISQDDRAGHIHGRIEREVQRLGGLYSPLAPPNAAGETGLWTNYKLNRHTWHRTEARITTLDPLYLWTGLGPYHMVNLYTTENSRVYWIHVVAPEKYFPRAWTKIKRILENATFLNVPSR